jgi:hypothetical protein
MKATVLPALQMFREMPGLTPFHEGLVHWGETYMQSM